MTTTITPGQMKRLQVLYGQHAAHAIEGTSREARMAWASDRVRRPLASFKDLTGQEADSLIDELQGQLGIKAPRKRRPKREQARRQGLDGRRDGAEFSAQPQIVSAADLAVIESYYQRLGWTREQFDAWLASPRSPLGRRARPSIATLFDGNRVRWALKRMLQQRGLWEVRRAVA